MKHLFFGGIHPKYKKEMSTGITSFRTINPKQVVIPMQQHIGAPCEPVVKVGDEVKVGDILFTYETDKASFECESTEEGTLLEIFFNDGDEVPCLVNVCAVGNPGEDCSALRPDGAQGAQEEAVAAPVEEVKDAFEEANK